MKILVSVVTACYNEEENIQALYERVKSVFDKMPHYCYEHIFIDNASQDKTVAILKTLAKEDKNISNVQTTLFLSPASEKTDRSK